MTSLGMRVCPYFQNKMAFSSAPFSNGGFSFENCKRNAMLEAAGYPVPEPKKTGTTITGIIYKDGVILGADTRSSFGSTIMEKNCSKIHYLAPNIFCSGAGLAADLQMVTRLIESQLKLHRLNTGRIVPVVCARTLIKHLLFRYQGHLEVALIVGGADSDGGSVYGIFPQGSSDKLPYVTMGSGSLAAMAVLELEWIPNLTREDGLKLVTKAIKSGILNDLASGSNVDLCVITRDGYEFARPHEVVAAKSERQGTYHYRSGTAAVLSMETIPLEVVESHESQQEQDVISEDVIPSSSGTMLNKEDRH